MLRTPALSATGSIPFAAGSDEVIGGSTILLILLILIGLITWFLPAAIAIMRQHHNAVPITLATIFLGWTCIGWLLCLIWSFSAADDNKRGVLPGRRRPRPRQTYSDDWRD